VRRHIPIHRRAAAHREHLRVPQPKSDGLGFSSGSREPRAVGSAVLVTRDPLFGLGEMAPCGCGQFKGTLRIFLGKMPRGPDQSGVRASMAN